PNTLPRKYLECKRPDGPFWLILTCSVSHWRSSIAKVPCVASVTPLAKTATSSEACSAPLEVSPYKIKNKTKQSEPATRYWRASDMTNGLRIGFAAGGRPPES